MTDRNNKRKTEGPRKVSQGTPRPGHTYRGARRNRAKRIRLLWSECKRKMWNGGIFVEVPE